VGGLGGPDGQQLFLRCVSGIIKLLSLLDDGGCWVCFRAVALCGVVRGTGGIVIAAPSSVVQTVLHGAA
jgi:hypothetical protein